MFNATDGADSALRYDIERVWVFRLEHRACGGDGDCSVWLSACAWYDLNGENELESCFFGGFAEGEGGAGSAEADGEDGLAVLER